MNNLSYHFNDCKFNDLSEIVFQLKTLHKLAKILNYKRLESGSINIDLPKTKFSFNECGLPTDITHTELSNCENLLQEFGILVNKLTADYLFNSPIRDFALFYRHPSLNDSRFTEIQRFLTINKLNADFSNPIAINEMLLKHKRNNENKHYVISLILVGSLKIKILYREIRIYFQYPI